MNAFTRHPSEPSTESATAILTFLGNARGDGVLTTEALIALTDYLKANVHRYITYERYTALEWDRS